MAGYLRSHPGASAEELLAASRPVRQEVYSWLFKTRHKRPSDSRIRTMLEVEGVPDHPPALAGWATRSTAWCRRWRPPSAAPATARPPWPS